jgi:hypothetical protein
MRVQRFRNLRLGSDANSPTNCGYALGNDESRFPFASIAPSHSLSFGSDARLKLRSSQ